MTGAWLEDRSPLAPDGLRGRMARDLEAGAPLGMGPGEAKVAALAASAKAALARAMSTGGTDREVAMDLLAADGLLTYACEAAVHGEDPGSQIDAILSHFRDPEGP